jgi:predicted cupin superfamily sugar epimerase
VSEEDAPPQAVRLGLERHPEGGWYLQTWRAPTEVTLPDGRVRPTATLIWFLLPAGESSAWHRVASVELWLAHQGAVRLQLGGDGPEPGAGAVCVVGTADGQDAQVVVPAQTWQKTLPADDDALVRCLVSPGFDFADFELVPDQETG